jgi:hypothetical protein
MIGIENHERFTFVRAETSPKPYPKALKAALVVMTI